MKKKDACVNATTAFVRAALEPPPVLVPVASNQRDPAVLLEYAERCFLIGAAGSPAAAQLAWTWLFRLAGAPG